MINTKELRRDADDALVAHVPFEICGSELIELLDRLEAAEKKSKELKNRLDLVYQELSARREALSRIISERDKLSDELALKDITLPLRN